MTKCEVCETQYQNLSNIHLVFYYVHTHCECFDVLFHRIGSHAMVPWCFFQDPHGRKASMVLRAKVPGSSRELPCNLLRTLEVDLVCQGNGMFLIWLVVWNIVYVPIYLE